MPDPPPAGVLDLRREAKVADLLGGGRFEASGVVAVDARFYVIFDNTPRIACLGRALEPGDRANRLLPSRLRDDVGYEDIAHDRASGHFYALVESQRHAGGYLAMVREYDRDFVPLADAWLPFGLAGPNKGLEGLTCVQRAGATYLLGLCEGNRCAAGDAGREPGGGRIQVFRRGADGFAHAGTIALPPSLWFADFSSVALAGDRLCVVSQEASALWVGRLARSTWRVLDDGAVYGFPRDGGGKVVYCNVEGVAWLPGAEVVVVSDKMKPAAQKARCRLKDQSIHVFAIP